MHDVINYIYTLTNVYVKIYTWYTMVYIQCDMNLHLIFFGFRTEKYRL